METLKKFIFILFLIINVLFFFSSYTIKSDNELNLIMKNSELKSENDYLKNKLTDIEYQIDTIQDFNEYINNQILGIDNDTINYEYYGDMDTTNVDSSLIGKLTAVSNLVTFELEKRKQTASFTNLNEFVLDTYPNISPTKQSIKNLTSKAKFGLRMHPILNKVLLHKGIDISVPYGTPIYSTMSGFVKEVRYSNYGYGNLVIIHNGNGYETRYAHLSKIIDLEEGNYVEKGQLIANSGNSGLSTSPHLHYEIRNNGKLENPVNYILN